MIYDLTEMNIYVSYGYKDDKTGFTLNAYERPYIKFNAKELFSEQKPWAIIIFNKFYFFK